MPRPRNYLKAFKSFLVAEAKGRCGYCGKEFAKGIYKTIDHIDAKGPDDISNYMICCQSCNTSKGIRNIDSFRVHMAVKKYINPSDVKFNMAQSDWLLSQPWFPYKDQIESYQFYWESIPEIVARIRY